MVSNDLDFAVLEFMRESGTTALHQRTTGAYDPALSKVVEVVATTPMQCIMLDYTLRSNGLSANAGTEIQSGDKQLFVRPVHKTTPGATPIVIDSTTDNILLAGVLYKIVNVKEINPTGIDAILYELQIRR
jgi:hypothetical protein